MSDGEQSDWRRLLTHGERAQMLDDIVRVSLTAGARLFPGQPWQDLDVSAGSLAACKSPVERLGFIESSLPILMQAIEQMRRDPLTTAARQSRRTSPAFRARRITTQAVLQAVRQGPDLRSLEETVAVASCDTPENRAVKSFLWVLKQDCAAISAIAAAEEEAEAAQRAENCIRRLRGLLNASWWEEVVKEDAAWTQPATQRAIFRTEYLHVFQEITRYRAGFSFDWDNPRFTLPPRDSWRLYETWCLFTVIDALRALGYEPAAEAEGSTPNLFTIREGRLVFTLAAGTAGGIVLRSPEDRRLSLVYNHTFAEGRRSLSHTMQPDISLMSAHKIWILDAKFKPYALPGEEGDDINQMHAYRDAIVDASGQRTVACAWCLYAGQVDALNRSHITYSRSDKTAIGALCLRPGNAGTFTNLCALLADWLQEEQPIPARPGSLKT